MYVCMYVCIYGNGFVGHLFFKCNENAIGLVQLKEGVLPEVLERNKDYNKTHHLDHSMSRGAIVTMWPVA